MENMNVRYIQENGINNLAFEHGLEEIESKTDVKSSYDVARDEESGKTKERAQWGSSVEFLMSCIAMSVGLGNIWRFPFTAYENGGGAFLIPYLIVLVVIGRPVYYLEMCLGQFTGRGNVQMFGSMAPAVKGMGYGQLFAGFCTATYYSCLMALTLFYLVNSFTGTLPWSECRPELTPNNTICVPSKVVASGIKDNSSVSSSELWFKYEVLQELDNIDDGIGLPEWRLTLCLLFAWIFTFLVTMKGIKSSGKVAYFLAIFPYVVLIALLIRACTLEGSAKGILYFIRPNWQKLTEAKVWYEAIVQCFFSLTVGFGTITMYSSYNNFDHNVHRDALIVTSMDTFTSLLAGTTIFGILGNLAHKLKMDVNDVIKSGGAGLAFISYPEAIAKFEEIPWFFSILFFIMLFTLGIGSLVSLQSCAYTVIKDRFPHLKSWVISGSLAIICFLIGLVYVTPGGQYILTLVDHFGGTFILFVLTTMEVVLTFWWYGLDNFCLDVEYMLKRKVGWYWRINWGFLTPVVMIVVLVYFIVSLEPLSYNSQQLPTVVQAIGWLLLFIGILQPFIWWAYYVYQNRKLGFKKAFKDSISHTMWGPLNQENCQEWKEFRAKIEAESLTKQRTWYQRKLDVFLGR